jgi:hypothetical protein
MLLSDSFRSRWSAYVLLTARPTLRTEPFCAGYDELSTAQPSSAGQSAAYVARDSYGASVGR